METSHIQKYNRWDYQWERERRPRTFQKHFNIVLLKLIYFGIQNASVIPGAELFLTLK